MSCSRITFKKLEGSIIFVHSLLIMNGHTKYEPCSPTPALSLDMSDMENSLTIA